MESPLLYRIAFTLIPGIGSVNGKKLIRRFGSIHEIFHASAKDLLAVPGIGPVIVNNIKSSRVMHRAEQEIRFLEKHKVQALFFEEASFPQRLLNCYDHPLMLFYRGEADLNHRRIIAFVGTRRATDYGKSYCREIIAGLREKDIVMVSGLAYGIDGCAHREAVEQGIPTIGVLGHGLDRIYPAPHHKLAEDMLRHGGGLLTEFLSKTIPDRENFPKRNRIVAGMVDAVVVVESDRKGGALITAELANSYNRDVFAVPGRLNDQFSNGCNFLIKTNKAALIQSADDIGYIMGWEDRKIPEGRQTQLFIEMNDTEKALYRLLEEEGTMSIDKLTIRTGFTPSSVASALLNMEFSGLVRSLPGKQYKTE